ncbi:MAG TPA: TadE/TadG family type IV pilus assembly protein [Acidobacteriaceae bacterium]|jgi:Flp pilus assembly protein TadG
MIRAAVPSFSSDSASRRADAATRPKGNRALADPRITRTSHNESGSSIVEFALTSSILFALVFGVMAICLALYSYNVVAETAREACRYAIVRGSACNSFSDCNLTPTQLQAYVQNTYAQNLGFAGINPGTTAHPLLTATPSWPAGNKNPGSPVQVTVTYTFPLVIPFVPSRTLTMSSTSQMVISQ